MQGKEKNAMFESKDCTIGIYNRVDVNQLGYCNAFIRKCYIRDMKGFILIKCELVSYCTPVVAITYKLEGTQKQVLCAPAATCSNTTRKHVGRFLKEHCVPITYMDVKSALETPVKPNYCNGLRLIDLQTGIITGYKDPYNQFDVRYYSIKPF